MLHQEAGLLLVIFDETQNHAWEMRKDSGQPCVHQVCWTYLLVTSFPQCPLLMSVFP